MQEKVAAILFADIMNSSEYANVMSTTNYHLFIIKSLKEICADEEAYFCGTSPQYKPLPNHPTKEQLEQTDYNCQFRAVGDEIRVFLYSGNEDADTNYLAEIAIRLKLRWLFCEFNKTRVKQNKPPEELAIGINTGPVIIEENNPEGFSINVGKRIEGECRNGTQCRILAHANSVNYIQAFQRKPNARISSEMFFSDVWTFSGKGIAQEIPIRELKFFNFLGQAEVLRFLDVDPKFFIKHLFASANMAPYPHFINSTLLSALQKLGIDDNTFGHIEDICKRVYSYLQDDEILDMIIQVFEYRYRKFFKIMGAREKILFLQAFYNWSQKNEFRYRYVIEDIQKEQGRMVGSFKHLPNRTP